MSTESNLRKHLLELCEQPRTPHSEGYQAAQKYLRKTLQSWGYDVKSHPFVAPFLGRCENLYVETGDLNQPAILVGAHYESRKESGLAADDNASAVSVVLELARHFSKESHKNFTFVFFDVEERFYGAALRGSRAFAKFYTRPIKKVFILDLVGGSMLPGLENAYFQFGEGTEKLEHPRLRFFHFPTTMLEPLGSWKPRSDYDAFRKRGIPFTFLSTGTPWYYHTSFDTPEIIRWDKMTYFYDALLAGLERPGAKANWNHLNEFVDAVLESPELHANAVFNLKKKSLHPSRWDIVRFYFHVLSKIRKQGPKLWQAAD